MFSIISVTAPLAGVIVGGTFADRYGGYKGKNVIKALKLCCAFGLVSFVFAFPIGFLYSIVYVSVLLWAFLFFGAAVVPVGTGIMVSSVKRYKMNNLREFQSTSSSLSQIIFNLLGYFSSPILTGIIIDQFKDKNQGYKWGMRLILWWSIFAVIFIGLALIFAYRKYKIAKLEKDETDLVDPMNQNMVDLVIMKE
jgi:MFS family permease